MEENNKTILDKAKDINWSSRENQKVIVFSVLGLVILGVGQFFTLQQKPDANIINYILSIASFVFVVLFVPTAYSTLGKIKGLISEKLRGVQKENDEHLETIGKNNWELSLQKEVDRDNALEKLRILKAKIIIDINNDPSNLKLAHQKSLIFKCFEYLENNDPKLKEYLEENNFDLDSLKINYEHIDYNDLFSVQSSSLSRRKRKLNIEKTLLKKSILQRAVLIVFGGWFSMYLLLFGINLVAIIMFIYQSGLVAWASFTMYNSAFNLVVNELYDIIVENNRFLKISITKFFAKVKHEETREPTQEEQEEIDRKAEIKAEKIELKALEDAERKFEREFKIEERKMKHDLKMAEIRAKSEIAKAQLIASKTVEVTPTPIVKENVSANPNEVVVVLKTEK